LKHISINRSPQWGPGAYTTPIDFYLIKKKGSLHLSGIRFCDFSYIFYLYTQNWAWFGCSECM